MDVIVPIEQRIKGHKYKTLAGKCRLWNGKILQPCCEFLDCIKRPSYGLELDRIIKTCEKHKTDGMIDLVSKKCSECNKYASFGYLTDNIRIRCKNHKTDCMINLKNKKRCEKCDKIPSFGTDSDKILRRCKEHKEDNMIDLVSKKCEKCNKIPTFGYKKRNPLRCKNHKTDDMVDVINKHCEKCSKRPSFGYEYDKKVLRCKNHKTDDMVDVVNKHCMKCNKQPTFGYEIDEIRRMCYNHKSNDMISLVNKQCENCNKTAIYGFEDDMKKRCCTEHKTKDMIELSHKSCKMENCLVRANPNYDNYCTHCFLNLFPSDPRSLNIQTKSKEMKVISYLANIYKDFIHDKPLYVNLSGGCCNSKRRIDLRHLFGNTILAIEIDEEQRKYHLKLDRYDDLFMDFSGKYIFIRYNPDPYRDKQSKKHNPSFEDRMKILTEEINKHISRIKEEMNKELVEIHYIFYHEDKDD